MNKLSFILMAAFFGVAHAADQASDEDLIRQGKELVKKYSAQVDKASDNPSIPSLNTDANSPLLQQHQSSRAGQKDFMDLATGKKKLSQVSAKKSELLIFVSFSLPEETLKQYSKQASEYGAVLVLRGFHNNSLQQTKLRALSVNPTGAEWDIAPATFKKFKIDRVPAIVLADATNESVLENGCAKEGDYLRVDGDISVHQSLVIMKQYGKGKLVRESEVLLETENH